MLDRLYELGFTEAAGNFQQDNFGRGGLGGDAVVADAQDKSGLDPSFLTRNNADFTPFLDGDPSQQPRMQMFVWDGPDPQRDGALDAEVILHEYTHGLSYRLVGGGNALSFGGQSGAMGEGWSDFFALSLLSQPGEDPAATYALGAYPTLEPFYLPSYDQNYYFGLRRYPNSTDMGKNPLTFKDIDPAQASQHMGVPLNPLAIAFPGIPADEVHNAGEVWCVALWEMRAKLIAKLGPTIGEAQANERALQLVVDGMKLTPPFPNFVQARDAILLAEQIRSAQTQDPNDSDLEDLWEAFAKRGLGSGAAVHHLWSVDGLNEYFPVQEDFSVPPPGWEFSITGSSSAPAVGPDGTVYVGSTDGHVYAVDREGNLMWRFPDQDPGLQPFKSTPAISSGGTIYIGCDDHKLYALNPDGTLKWDFETQGAVVSSPAVGRDGAIYFGSMDGGFHALEPDGSPLRAPIQLAPIQSSPAIGQFIPAGSPVQIIVGVSGVSGGLRAFREDNGSSLWAATAIGEVLTSLAIGPFHSVYVGAGNQLHSIAQDGAIQWSMPLDSPVVGSPVIGPHNNPGNGQWVVYVGTTGAKVWAIRVSSTSHSLLWSVQLPSLRAGIALDGNGVVFAGGDEAVYAMANGQLSFTMPLPGENVTSAPGIGPDGTLYFTTNQKLHALRQLASPPGLVWPMFHRDARRLGNSTVITLTAKGLTSDGRFRFTLENPMPFPVVLEASEDLVQWEELTSIGALLTFDLVDPDTGTHARRFFRARVP